MIAVPIVKIQEARKVLAQQLLDTIHQATIEIEQRQIVIEANKFAYESLQKLIAETDAKPTE
jgi:hypothetical protein